MDRGTHTHTPYRAWDVVVVSITITLYSHEKINCHNIVSNLRKKLNLIKSERPDKHLKIKAADPSCGTCTTIVVKGVNTALDDE